MSPTLPPLLFIHICSEISGWRTFLNLSTFQLFQERELFLKLCRVTARSLQWACLDLKDPPLSICVRACVRACVCVSCHSVISDSCGPMDYSLPGASVHGVSESRILEWVAISSPRGSSPPRDWTCVFYVSCIAGRFFSHWAIREAHVALERSFIPLIISFYIHKMGEIAPLW